MCVIVREREGRREGGSVCVNVCVCASVCVCARAISASPFSLSPININAQQQDDRNLAKSNLKVWFIHAYIHTYIYTYIYMGYFLYIS